MLKQFSLDFDYRFAEVQDRLDVALVKAMELYPLDLEKDVEKHRRVVQRMFQYANGECEMEAVKYSFQNWIEASLV